MKKYWTLLFMIVLYAMSIDSLIKVITKDNFILPVLALINTVSILVLYAYLIHKYFRNNLLLPTKVAYAYIGLLLSYIVLFTIIFHK